METMNKEVVIITPVYNRASKVQRTFDSVLAQTYKNIRHIVIDNGSNTDNPAPVMEAYKKSADYAVDLVYIKENGGKHFAINTGWRMLKGDEYVVHLDSDDELLPDAIEKLVNVWNKVYTENSNSYGQYWCVTGRCIDQIEHKMVGPAFPENINSLSFEEAKRTAETIGGDKLGMMRADILKEYTWPEHQGVNYVVESVMWDKINKLYRTYYTNEVCRIYYINDGECVSNAPKNEQHIDNYCFSYRNILSHLHDYEYGAKRVVKLALNYSTFYHLARKNIRKDGYLTKTSIDLLLVPIYPITYFLALAYKKRKMG